MNARLVGSLRNGMSVYMVVASRMHHGPFIPARCEALVCKFVSGCHKPLQNGPCTNVRDSFDGSFSRG